MATRKIKASGRAVGVTAALAMALTTALTVVPTAAADPVEDELLPLTQYVDLLIGTSIPTSSGYMGNVAPGAQVPFGMVNFGPDQPRNNYNGSGGARVNLGATQATINFFSVTHLNGPGCPGGGVVGMMPASTPTSVTNAQGNPLGVTYLTAKESAKPGHYSVDLNNNVKVDLTSTNRTGMARFTYPDETSGYFSLDTRLNANSNLSSTRGKITTNNISLTVSEDGKVMSGKTVAPAFCTPWGTNFNSNVFFYAEFDKPLRTQEPGSTVNTVVNGGGLFQYDVTAEDPTLNLRVGISSVSVANAKQNLQTENPNSTFDQVKAASEAEWNERLNLAQVDMAANPSALTEAQRLRLTEFYTSLYRIFITPTTYSDVNGDYRSIRATPPFLQPLDVTGWVQARQTENVANDKFTRADGTEVIPKIHYSGLSMWDTYRSAAQALTLFAPEVSNEVMQSLVIKGTQCGAFPHWTDNSDDSVPMAGDNALAVLAASYSFGATDFDVTEAARLVKQSVFDPTSNCNGRDSAPYFERYISNGYMDSTIDGNSSSHTIERNAADHAAAVFLTSIPQEILDTPRVRLTAEDIAKLNDRSTWWKNIFDYENARIGGRAYPTTPGELGAMNAGGFHEATEPNYFWSFGYAWPDLVDALGSKEAAVERLNALFSLDDELTNVPTRKQLNGGQDSQTLYIGNEPPFPSPWAYNFAGRPAATQYIVQQILETAWTPERDGLPGNEDFGAMGSWFVFASLGMFPYAQAHPGFALSTPQFPAMTVHWGDKTLRITTDADPIASPFIKSMTINGQPHNRSQIDLDELLSQDNVTLNYELSTTATDWAASTAPFDPSTSNTVLKLSDSVQTLGTDDPVVATASVLFSDNISQPGTVELYSDGELISSGPVVRGGSAKISIPADLPFGRHQITAKFVPSDNARTAASTSNEAQLIVFADPVVDKSVLQSVVDSVGALSNDDGTFTAESWNALQTELAAAEAVLNNASATQEEVDTAVADLTDALTSLEVATPAVDKSVLQSVVDSVGTLSNDDGTYTAESWDALQAKLAAAEAVLNNASATQEEVNAAVSALVVALTGLELAPPTELQVVRHSGANRYETSLKMLSSATPGAPIFVATGIGFADALSAAPAAALEGGRVVLTHPRNVDPQLIAQITAKAPKDIYVIGGTNAVSTAVENALKGIAGAEVTRIAGSSRYDTSLRIYDKFFAGEDFNKAFVATGRDFPDALAASAAAGAVDAPVVLVNGKAATVPTDVTDRLTADKVELTLIAGGKGAVSQGIENELKAKVGEVTRLSGSDRLATSVAINAWVDSKLDTSLVKDVYVATGASYPDALSAAAPAGNPAARLVLSSKTCLPKAAVNAIKSYTALQVLHLVGGQKALSDAVGELNECK